MVKSTIWLSLIGLTGGLLSSFAYPDHALWIAIFPATAIMLYAILSASIGQAWIVGSVTGFAFYASQIPWMTVYLGPVPWLALSVLEAVIFSVGAIAINASWRFAKNKLSNSPIITSALIASLWVAREWLACNFPYGGFPWSRLALSQSNSPLANWVYWGGDSLLSFVIVFITVLVMLTWTSALRPGNWSKSPIAALLAALIVFPQITQISTNPEAGNLRVAAVQGNANAGLFANPVPGSILKNHLNASAELKNQDDEIDVVIWPENAADINPLENPTAKKLVSDFVTDIDAPLIFGTITSRGDEIFNSSILWVPGTGPVDWYDKKRPVAFGEYVPDRAFFRALAPELIDLIPRGYSFGERDGIFEISAGAQTPVKLGTMICFEVAVDDISRDLVNQGAEMLVIQTNNADFGTTNESAQQLAIAKLRSIETGRAVVNISTVGLSAIFLPDGTTVDNLKSYTSDLMESTLPLRRSSTPAMALGASLEIANNFSALAQILMLLLIRARPRSRHAK